MEEVRRSNNGRIIAGVLVIIFGFLLLFDNLNYINSDLTPGFILSAIGIIIMINSRKKIIGAILLIIGISIFVSNIPGVDERIIFPAILILFGLYIIFRNRIGQSSTNANVDPNIDPNADPNINYSNRFGGSRFMHYKEPISKDIIDEVAIFGGGHKTFTSETFKGGNITAVFGGHEIDLTQCKLAEGENVLDVLTIFGGCEIIVPRDWNIILNVTPLFGGFSNKIRRDPNWVADPSRTLVIKGLVIFGGGELKAY